MSSRYLNTYIFYYFHINTNDAYDETQGQVQSWAILTYISRSRRLIFLSSRYIHTYSANYFHINMINTNDACDETQGQVQRWVTLTYFKVTEANKGIRLSSRYLHTYTLYYFHINISDPYNHRHRGNGLPTGARSS